AERQEQILQRARYLLLGLRHRLQELAARPGFRRPEELLREYRLQSDEFLTRLATALEARLERVRRRFTGAQTGIARFDLRARIAAARLGVERRTGELGVRAERFLRAQRQRLERLTVELNERSPLRLLERGYAIVYDTRGTVVRAAGQVALGEEVSVQLARGRLAAEVRRKEEK